jgi:high affinity sulfate transporter 1
MMGDRLGLPLDGAMAVRAARVKESGRGIRRFLPILDWLPGYRRGWFPADVVAGLSVWALLVPQALAYAAIAGVPVQYGLYTAFAALLAYAVFGTCRQMVQGPSATVAAVSAATVGPLLAASAFGTKAFVPLTAALALVTGAIYVALGLLRMGWVSNFLSKAVLAGFILGFAVGIIIDQSYKLLGVDKVEGSYIEKLVGTVEELPDTHGITLAVGAGALAFLLLMRRFAPRFPRALVAMSLSIAAVGAFDLTKHGVSITGPVPTGLFSVRLPGVGWGDVMALAAGAFAVVFVGFSESLASARMMALKHGYEISVDRELIAQGVACGAAGFVGGFVSDGSLSKTSVADAAGQRTQMASLIDAIFILLTMLFLATLFENLPAAALGAVVIDAMVGLIHFDEMKRYYRVNTSDWVFFMGAMLGILFFGVIQGILIGVVLSLLMLISRASKPAIRRLARDPRSDAYLDADRHEGLEESSGVLVVRVDGPLFFADADRFRDGLNELVERQPGPIRAVVLDADAISQTDTDGADVVRLVAGELEGRGGALALARVEPDVLALWARAGTIDAIGADRVYPTVRAAVEAVGRRSAPGQDGSSGTFGDRGVPRPAPTDEG